MINQWIFYSTQYQNLVKKISPQIPRAQSEAFKLFLLLNLQSKTQIRIKPAKFVWNIIKFLSNN